MCEISFADKSPVAFDIEYTEYRITYLYGKNLVERAAGLTPALRIPNHREHPERESFERSKLHFVS